MNALLFPKRASLSQPGLSPGGLAKNSSARTADDDGLGVREDGSDIEAPWALNIHEEGPWGRHKHLKSVVSKKFVDVS